MNVPSAPIPADTEDAAIDQNTPVPYKTPLPKLQLAILCAVRLMDPVTFTQIFPYINEFISRLHLVEDDSQIGFYSGLVESTFALFQLLSIYQWAKLSDDPVVVGGTFGLALATFFLGFTSSLRTILLSRALAGLFSGIAAVLHSVLGELTDSTNQHIAFPLYGLFWPLGSILGPILGGSLANPAKKYPDVFGEAFFEEYPYFLPCFAAGLLAFATAVFGVLSLSETSHIGYALAIAGTSSIAIQILILPTLLIKFGHAHLYNFCMLMWPVAYALMPFLNIFAYSRIQLWVAMSILLSISRVACLAYSHVVVLYMSQHAACQGERPIAIRSWPVERSGHVCHVRFESVCARIRQLNVCALHKAQCPGRIHVDCGHGGNLSLGLHPLS
ncbi:MFS general substrate transporter [Coprinellus micaceus]|uniref:MFS general substrate transporter n=1 Tax=Coprinellus micaceus TaxID=71717 RepID=A0A4Y7TQU7_COPMI|nr:MFS general substrate transporter [Coprinellus micaceus]